MLKSLTGIEAAFDSQVKVEKAANAKQIKDVQEEVTLATASQTMKEPQKRARPNPPMSVKNPPMEALEESKDPVVPRGITVKPQPEAHRAQNLPTLQQHVRAARGGQGIPLDQLQKFQNSYSTLVMIMAETDLAPSVMQFAVAVAAFLNMETELKQVWSQPPGTGKTRTLVSLVYLLSTLKQQKHITIRCPSKVLLDQDQFAL